jgi:nicotinate-nucleotide adenylyltransferase
MVTRIGILGGTFDPIHNGHLYLARKVLAKLRLDKVLFIPTYLPPHKTDIEISPAKHRYNMVKLAIKNNKKLGISDIEIRRKGRSYSVHTLRQLRKKYGEGAEIFFITGSDSLKELEKWKDLEEILGLCKFVVVERPGFFIKRACRKFIILRINAKNISSTDIRTKVKTGLSVNRLVPSTVAMYIEKHSLYN